MIKRIIQTISLLCIISFNAFGDNVLTVDDTNVSSGSTYADISVKMNNSDDITAIQFDLDLPEGISLVSSSNVTISERTTEKKHNVVEVSSFDGITRVMIASSKNSTFSGSEGIVCSLNLTLDPAKIGNGEYKIAIKNIYLSKTDGTIFQPNDCTAKLNVVTFVKSIALDKHKESKIWGDSFKLTASLLPENATNKTVKWTSSDEKVATVDAEGAVKCISAGNVTIKATTTDGSNLSDSCAVFVDNPTYRIVYKVDGNIYKEDSVKYLTKIIAPTVPSKEGYTFSGWSEIPTTMPARDVEVNGRFVINKYKLVYVVDGEEYKSSEVEYASKLTAIAAPTKEGYTFSGWSEIPSNMPANDVTITGSFKVNTYTITYKVDGEVYKTVKCDYGSNIELIANPTKDGYTFSGWSEAPSTMPANDIVISGSFEKNYEKEDVNQDGKVDSQDVLKVYEYIRDSTSEPTSTTVQDVNKDGKVDSQDILKIYEYIRDH